MPNTFVTRLFPDREDPHVRLQELFDDYSTTMGAPPSSRTWTEEVLKKNRIDPRTDPEDAINALRAAHPRITRRIARFLVDDARMR